MSIRVMANVIDAKYPAEWEPVHELVPGVAYIFDYGERIARVSRVRVRDGSFMGVEELDIFGTETDITKEETRTQIKKDLLTNLNYSLNQAAFGRDSMNVFP
jgi:hypothetical protein